MELPRVGDPLQPMGAERLEGDARSGHQALDHARHHCLPWPGDIEQAGGEVDRDPADVIASL